MDEPLPPVQGNYKWSGPGGLRGHIERVDEMLALAVQLKKPSFMVEGIPSQMLSQVAEVFRGRGHVVLKGRSRLLVEVTRDE